MSEKKSELTPDSSEFPTKEEAVTPFDQNATGEFDPLPQDASEIFKRDRELTKLIRDKIKQLKAEFKELRYAYRGSSASEREKLDDNMDKNIEEQEKLELEKQAIEDKIKQEIVNGKKNRE